MAETLPPVAGAALYRITRTVNGVQAVYVDENRRQYELPFAGIHSPTGFEIGYAGSGPAELALSILAHHLKLRGVTRETFASIPIDAFPDAGDDNTVRVWRLHKEFKDRFIASASRDAAVHEITAEAVAAFVFETESRQP